MEAVGVCLTRFARRMSSVLQLRRRSPFDLFHGPALAGRYSQLASFAPGFRNTFVYFTSAANVSNRIANIEYNAKPEANQHRASFEPASSRSVEFCQVSSQLRASFEPASSTENVFRANLVPVSSTRDEFRVNVGAASGCALLNESRADARSFEIASERFRGGLSSQQPVNAVKLCGIDQIR